MRLKALLERDDDEIEYDPDDSVSRAYDAIRTELFSEYQIGKDPIEHIENTFGSYENYFELPGYKMSTLWDRLEPVVFTFVVRYNADPDKLEYYSKNFAQKVKALSPEQILRIRLGKGPNHFEITPSSWATSATDKIQIINRAREILDYHEVPRDLVLSAIKAVYPMHFAWFEREIDAP